MTLLAIGQTDLKLEDFKVEHQGKEVFLYEGLLEGYHPVMMALAFEDKSCSGYYQFSSSGVSFNLEGDLEEDDTIMFVELDESDQISGYLTGKYSHDQFELNWKDVKKMTELKLQMKRVNAFGEANSYFQEKSLVKMVAHSYGKQIDIWQDVLEKKINIVGQNFPYFSFQYRCNDDCTKIESKSLRKGSEYHTFQMIPFNEEKETLTFFKKDGTKFMFVGEKEETIYMKHKTFADYRVMIDLSYPVTQSFEFNKWIEGNINKVQKTLLDEIYDSILDDQGDIPDERYQFEAYSWYDIDYISKDIISGTITHTKSWKSDTKKIAFIFDNKEQRMLKLRDLFKSKFDYETFMSEFLEEEKNNITVGSPDGPKLKWINDDSFDNISINEMGLICNSDYSVIFGDSKIIIPFEAIKKHLGNKSIKSEFAN